jgi:hypothetical protein
LPLQVFDESVNYRIPANDVICGSSLRLYWWAVPTLSTAREELRRIQESFWFPVFAWMTLNGINSQKMTMQRFLVMPAEAGIQFKTFWTWPASVVTHLGLFCESMEYRSSRQQMCRSRRLAQDGVYGGKAAGTGKQRWRSAFRRVWPPGKGDEKGDCMTARFALETAQTSASAFDPIPGDLYFPLIRPSFPPGAAGIGGQV